jgi:hypothetical protein
VECLPIPELRHAGTPIGIDDDGGMNGPEMRDGCGDGMGHGHGMSKIERRMSISASQYMRRCGGELYA